MYSWTQRAASAAPAPSPSGNRRHEIPCRPSPPTGSLAIAADALPGVPLRGTITRISPSADPNSRVFEVEAALPNQNGRLKVGMLATLSLAPKGATAGSELFVPLAAVVRPAADSSGYAVYVVADSQGQSRARLAAVSAYGMCSS